MNGPIKQKLGVRMEPQPCCIGPSYSNNAQLPRLPLLLQIPKDVTWGGQSGAVFEFLSGDFMKPVWDGVDTLLKDGFPVTVYTGQLDLICCTTGKVPPVMWAALPSRRYMLHDPRCRN